MLTDDTYPPTAPSSPPKPSATNVHWLPSLALARPSPSSPLSTPPASPLLPAPARPQMTQSASSSTTTADYSRDDAKPPPSAPRAGMLSTQPMLAAGGMPAPLPIPVPTPGSLQHGRTGSRDSSRRRLTTSLVQVLKGKRGESSGSNGSDETDIPTTRSTPTHSSRPSLDDPALSAPRSVPHLSRSGTANNSSVLLPPPPPSPGLAPTPPSSPPRSSKPPVSLPNFLRRRLSSASDAESPVGQPPLIRRTSSQELLSSWTNRSGLFGARRNSNATPPSAELVPSRARAMSEEIQRPAFGIGSSGFSYETHGGLGSSRPALRARSSSVTTTGTPSNGAAAGCGARPSVGYGFFAPPAAPVNGIASDEGAHPAPLLDRARRAGRENRAAS